MITLGAVVLKKVPPLNCFQPTAFLCKCTLISVYLMQIQRSEDQHHGYFEVFLNHSLNVSPILSTISVSRYIQCAFSCLQNVLCFSFNVATVQDINSKQYACQLLPTDKCRNPDDFVLSQEFHHYATPVCFIWTCTTFKSMNFSS